ncbi:hypothetical protein POM88_050145 [Heracleum sosnowskyi]|uniref:Retrotransposon gag domain-containing protein n=1 Tax=Heracleum sosnowskyi TaxID=360622 RepID=A0AAD8GY88_9APIA|nr:hypothetical protein POM88_050145 [Heracleum sosnowskyi]
MTVTEYEAKFSELSRFVPEFVNTEGKKASRFQPGLSPTSSPLSGPLNSRKEIPSIKGTTWFWEIVQGFNELPDIDLDDMRMNIEYSEYNGNERMGNMRLEIRDAKRYPWKELMRFGKKGKCPTYVEYEQVGIQPGLTYKEQLVEITDRKEQVLSGEVAKLVRGLWKNKRWKNPPGI